MGKLLLQAFVIVTTLISVASCKKKTEEEKAQIQTAINIVNRKPNVALAILDDLKPASKKWNESDKMQFELLRVEAHDKNFDKQKSDSLMQKLVAYYDEHGNRNERMTAYYYMGSCYRDLGETPLALEWYCKAYEIADTTSNDFNRKRYMAIMTQAAEILSFENNYAEELLWYKRILDFLSDSEIDAALLNNAAESYFSNGLKDTASILFNKSFQLYQKENNWTDAAYMSISTQIAFFILQEDMENVEKRLPYFKCGLSNEPTGADEYNYALYHEKTGHIDTALYHYKMATKKGHPYVTRGAYQHLYNLYVSTGQRDSANWYAERYMSISDSLTHVMEEERTLRISKQYAYNRKQKELTELRATNLEFYNWMLALTLGLLVSGGACTVLWLHFKKQREKVMRQSCTIARQEVERKQLITRMKKLENKTKKMTESQIEDMDRLLRKFHILAGKNIQPELPDWKQLGDFFHMAYPALAKSMNNRNGKLSITSEQLCILTRFGFSSQEINALLSISRQNAYNLRIRISQQLAGKELGRIEDFTLWLQGFGQEDNTAN